MKDLVIVENVYWFSNPIRIYFTENHSDLSHNSRSYWQFESLTIEECNLSITIM